MRKTLQKLWHFLAGQPAKFSMENRAFNAVSAVGLIILFVFGILNFIIDLMAAGLVTLLAAALLLVLYYFARFRKQFAVSLMFFVFSSYILLAAGFFFNEGIDGPVIYLMIASFLMVLVVTPRHQQGYWLAAHLLVGGVLLYVQYSNPQTVPDTYSSSLYRFLDHYMSYLATIVFIFVLLHYLRKNYNYERNLAKRRTAELQRSNRIIRNQNEALQALNEEKDKLFSIISHDLRSPLSNMKGLLEVLDDDIVSEAEKKELQEDLSTLANNTFVLLENLLHWSSQKVKGGDRKFEAVLLAPAIEEAVGLLRTSLKAKNLHLQVSCWQDIKVKGDSEMLRIIVRNLLNNAVKFTPQDGRIAVSCHEDDKFVHLSVKDSGVGIPKEKQKTLLSDRQTSSFGTQNESGSGLGLVLSREYIQRMQGSIDFSSRINEGTEFRVKLPKPYSGG